MKTQQFNFLYVEKKLKNAEVGSNVITLTFFFENTIIQTFQKSNNLLFILGKW